MQLIHVICVLASLSLCSGSVQHMFASNKWPFEELSNECSQSVGATVLRDALEIIQSGKGVLKGGSLLIGSSGGIEQIASSFGALKLSGSECVVDLNFSQSIMAGIVGMHEHLFYPAKLQGASEQLYSPATSSFPALYLAHGVTTGRTTGSMHPFADINVASSIHSGESVGPSLHVTGPYLDGAESPFRQFYHAATANDTVNMMTYWRSVGFRNWKAYMFISRDQLAAAVSDAHAHGERVTGHLCSVTFGEAVARGIDCLEHGLIVATDFVADKSADVCPSQAHTQQRFVELDLRADPHVHALIEDLVSNGVSITSTLAVFEAASPLVPAPEPTMLETLTIESERQYEMVYAMTKASGNETSVAARAVRQEMLFERMFVEAGGNLMVGCDPTGAGGVVAGFADVRSIELLVEAGFTPAQAIAIATINGARYLGIDDKVGDVAVGLQADLIVAQGSLSTDISSLRNITAVFQNGRAFEPRALINIASRSVSWI
jgi:Amidohydrolase family